MYLEMDFLISQLVANAAPERVVVVPICESWCVSMIPEEQGIFFLSGSVTVDSVLDDISHGLVELCPL